MSCLSNSVCVNKNSSSGLQEYKMEYNKSSVAFADPESDVFRHARSGSGSIGTRYGYGSFYHQAKILRKTWIAAVL
jgi:hypothetical protein